MSITEAYTNGGTTTLRLDRVEDAVNGLTVATQGYAIEMQLIQKDITELKNDLFGDPSRSHDTGYFSRLETKLDQYIDSNRREEKKVHNIRSLHAMYWVVGATILASWTGALISALLHFHL